MKTLDYILDKLSLSFDETTLMPIEIPNLGRAQLAELFEELNYKNGAEIGVLGGEYSELLCRNNPGLKLYGIDPYKIYDPYKTQLILDEYKKVATDRLAPYNYHLIEKTSQEAVNDFIDGSLDFVYIDGDHKYENIASDINLWSKKVRPGGIISGHDYVRLTNPNLTDVIDAVHDYVKVNNIRPWFVLGLKKKYRGMVRDRYRFWMWVKS